MSLNLNNSRTIKDPVIKTDNFGSNNAVSESTNISGQNIVLNKTSIDNKKTDTSIIVNGINIELILNNIIRKNGDKDIINLQAFSQLTHEQQNAVLKYLYAKNQYEFVNKDANKTSWETLDLENKLAILEKTEIHSDLNPKNTSFLLKQIIGADRLGIALDSKAITTRSVIESFDDYLIDNYSKISQNGEDYINELTDEDKYRLSDLEFTSNELYKDICKKYKSEFQKAIQAGNQYVEINGIKISIQKEAPVYDLQTQANYIKLLGKTKLDYEIKEKENRLEKGYYDKSKEKELKLELKQLKAYNKKNVETKDITPIDKILNPEQYKKFESLQYASYSERIDFLQGVVKDLREKYKNDPDGFAKAIRDISYQLDGDGKSLIGFKFVQQVIASKNNDDRVYKSLFYTCIDESKFSLDLIYKSTKNERLVSDFVDFVIKNDELNDVTNTFSSAEVADSINNSVIRAKREGTISEATEIAFAAIQTDNEFISSDSRRQIGATTRKYLNEKANNYAVQNLYKIIPPALGIEELGKYTDSNETKWAKSNTDAAINAQIIAKFDKDYQVEAHKAIQFAIDNNFVGEDALSRYNSLTDQIQDCHQDNQKAMYETAMLSSNKEAASYAKQAYETRYTASAQESNSKTYQNSVNSSANHSTNPIKTESQKFQTSEQAIEQLDLNIESDKQKLVEIVQHDSSVLNRLDPKSKHAVLEVYCKRLDGAKIFELFKKNPSLYSELLNFSGEKLNMFKDEMFKILLQKSPNLMIKFAKELGIDLALFAKHNKGYATTIAIATKDTNFAQSILKNVAYYGLQKGSSDYFALIQLLQKENQNKTEGERPIYANHTTIDDSAKFLFNA